MSAWAVWVSAAVAAVMAAAVLARTRVSLGFRARWAPGRGGPSVTVEVGVGPWWRSLPVGWSRGAVRAGPRGLRLARSRVSTRTRFLAMAAGFTARAARGGRLDRFDVDVRLGFGDAALTGIGAGMLQGAVWTLAATAAWQGTRPGMRPEIVIQPDFRPEPDVALRLHCIWSWTVGQVMAVSVREAARHALGRLRESARAVQRRGPRRERASDPGTDAHGHGQP